MLLWVVGAIGNACIWDRDTLADEAKNHGDIVNVITGRFPRNPPLYYEMRLERVAKELDVSPDKLELYDDAGVACDRLGRGDEAIEWMAKKRVALERLELAEKHDHRYRYHANLGTFLAHRWFRNGKDFSDMTDLEEGAKHIRKALEINPDAHFGREEYQLKFMEWVLAKPAATKAYGEAGSQHMLNDFMNFTRESAVPEDELAEASKGLTGLVVLGNAWESVDVFLTLMRIHDRLRNGSVKELSQKRALELASLGRKPVLGAELTSDTLQVLINYQPYGFTGMPEHEFDYMALRANADSWQQHRTAFMLSKMTRGKHPDTDADFWHGYEEVPEVDLPVDGEALSELKNRQELEKINNQFRFWERIALGVAGTLAAGILFRKIRRRKGQQPS